MAVFAGVIVAASGDCAGLKTFKSKMESGREKQDNNLKLHF